MITFLESIIGTTYSQDPVPFVLCFMLVCWFVYLVVQLLYSALGLE